MQYSLRVLSITSLLVLLVNLQCILALYDQNGPVTLITEENFREEVLLTEVTKYVQYATFYLCLC